MTEDRIDRLLPEEKPVALAAMLMAGWLRRLPPPLLRHRAMAALHQGAEDQVSDWDCGYVDRVVRPGAGGPENLPRDGQSGQKLFLLDIGFEDLTRQMLMQAGLLRSQNLSARDRRAAEGVMAILEAVSDQLESVHGYQSETDARIDRREAEKAKGKKHGK